MKFLPVACLLALLTVGLGGCEDDDKVCNSPADDCTPDPTYNPVLEPAEFVEGVDHPYWPLVPGTVTVFQAGDETVTVTVTGDLRTVAGISSMVVHDVVAEEGEVIEDTYDWYAQDSGGNVWYMGEDTEEYEDGVLVSTAGSWEAGVDGAKAGIIMPAVQPPIGIPYRQEYYACEAEDFAETAGLDESVTVPYGSFTHCLKTREFTPLEPDVNEYKYYADGIGFVLQVDINTGQRTELVSVTNP